MMDDGKSSTSGCGMDTVGNPDSSTAHRESDSTTSALQPQTSGGAACFNPHVDRLRQTLMAAGVQDSLDDDEMREYDPHEHLETLGAGIPQHLAQKTGPRYVKPRHFDSTDDETASVDCGATGDSADELELSPVVKGTFGSCSMTSQNNEAAKKMASTSGDRLPPDLTSLAVGGASCSSSIDGV